MIDYQRKILADTLRNEAFAKALQKVITPKTVVADIGSGTGFLSFLASKLGAKECHLYEVSDLLPLSKKIAKKNNITNCQFTQEVSFNVRKPVQADLVVSETLGNFALEENIIEILNDAKRFVKPEGTLMPQVLRQYVAPVFTPRLYEEVDAWDHVGHHLNFEPAKHIAMQNMYVKTVQPEDVGNGDIARLWDELDFREENSSIRESTVEWAIEKKETLYGFATWWECDLLPGISISTSPYTKPTHWEQIYLPVLTPLTCEKGDTVELTLHCDTRLEVKIRLVWTIVVRSKKGNVKVEQQLDSNEGLI